MTKGDEHAPHQPVPERRGDRARPRGLLRILAETGVRVHGELGLKLLEDGGAEVNHATGIAKIPRSLVEAALARAPQRWTLGARNPALDFPMPSAKSAYSIDGTAAFMQDFATGERRYGRKPDIVDAMRVLRACETSRRWPGPRSRHPTCPWPRARSTSSRRCSARIPATASTSCTPGPRRRI
ncbi:MAG: trimethylamine methyltransferase family protein [Chloroflexota bacterium]